MPEFEQRPGGVFQWNSGGVNYTDSHGGAIALDHPDVHAGDMLVICATAPPEQTGGRLITVNVIYPNGKQTTPREVPWGGTARIQSEQSGFMTVLVSANGNNRARAIIGRA